VKLSEARSAYQEVSGKASDVARSLAFAAVAIVWIFKVGEGPAAKPSLEFLPPLLLSVITLAFDLLQYVSLALAWGAYSRLKEWKVTDPRSDPDIAAPSWLNWAGVAFFWAKLICVVSTYVLLARILWTRWVA
jgi:hypothetical protein